MSSASLNTLCPNCGRPVLIPAERVGALQTCPHCGSGFLHTTGAVDDVESVPLAGNPAAADDWLPDSPPEEQPDEASYRLRPAEREFPVVKRPRSAIPSAGVSASLARSGIKAARLPPPPRWLYFSGVFGFPWYPETIWRWLFGMLGILLGGIALALVISLRTLLGFGFLLPLFIFVLAVVGSAMAANGLAVFEDTAHGHDRIQNWPENDMRELYPAFLGLVYLTTIAGLSGGLAGVLWEPLRGWDIAAGIFLLLPVLILSSQEADSVIAPVSGPVLRSFALCPGSWLGFYLLTGTLLGATAAACYFATVANMFLGAAAPAALVPALALIYPRLLGRLAWRIMREEERRASEQS